MKNIITKIAFAAALATGAAVITAAPASAQSFGFSVGGPGYGFSVNSGYPYGYYGRPYYGPAYYGYPAYYGPSYYYRPSYYSYSRPYYGGRTYYRGGYRRHR
jgi:hypothetical protein